MAAINFIDNGAEIDLQAILFDSVVWFSSCTTLQPFEQTYNLAF